MNYLSQIKHFFSVLASKYNLIVFTLWLLVLAGTTFVLHQQPFLGFTTKIANEQVLVDQVYDKNLPLSANTQIQAITAKAFEPIQLNATNTPVDPNTIAQTFADLNQLIKHNQKVATLFTSNTITILTAQKEISIQPTKRPLRSFPIAYWVTAISVLISSLIAVGILTIRKKDISAQLLAASAILFMLLSMVTSAYTYRILFLDPTIFEFYLNTQHFFGNWFSFAMLSLIAIYPQRLISNKVLFLLFFIEPLIFWLDDYFQLIQLPIHTFLFNSFIAATLFIFLAIIQTYLARKDPLRTAQVRWMLLSIFIMPIIDIFLYLIPIAVGISPLIPLWVVQMSIVVGFIGLGLGIARYRLFDIEHWWFKTWIWVIAGTLLVILDVILLAMLNITSIEAMSLALIIMAWLYFPARQWFWEKITKSPDAKLEDYLPILANSVFNSNTSGQSIDCWKQCLQEVFQAISTETYPQAIKQAQIENNGLSLLIPSISEQQTAIKLSGRNKGTRLFHKGDLVLAASINKIITQMIDVKTVAQQAAKQERGRIMRDLHDDVGANILSMIYRAKDEEQAQHARNTLKLLRESIYTLDDTMRSSLNSAIFEWQQEAQQRTRDADIELTWESHNIKRAITLSVRQKINIGRILRESISNALKHSQSNWIHITLEIVLDRLIIHIKNGGNIAAKTDWVEGKGINSIKTRTQELEGHVIWDVAKDNTQLTVTINLPLETQ